MGRASAGCARSALKRGKKAYAIVIEKLRVSTVLLLASSLAPGQSGQVVEPPEQGRKLLMYAAKLDADARSAVAAGRLRVAPQVAGPKASAEQLISRRAVSSNGIYVDQPKVYDDSLLEQMLGSAQSQLAGLQGFDQSGLTRAIGNITGATQQISSFGVSGGVQPPIVSTDTTTTTPAFTLPSSGAPAPTTTLPSGQAPSASDVLNEQLQITSEIANLRLLLEGSLSDQIMVGAHETFAKPRVTLGFPVVITPAKRYRNAVAVVEVFADTNKTNDASANGEPPSITALLPREKTYNVAAISDKSGSLGTGIATGIAGASASFLFGHKQYFIVKDQDTLGVQFEPSPAELAALAAQGVDTQRLRAFAWQFRPVLGRPFVQAGSRQVFVQLAFPGRGSVSVKSFGTVRVRTYWRRIDPKTGVLKEVIPGSLEESRVSTIPNYDMRQQYGAVAAFNPSWLEDLGSGNMLVKLEGRLLPGSYFRVGSNIVRPGSNGAPSDLKTTRFVAAIADLASLDTFIVSRDGTEYPLKIPRPEGTNRFYVDRANVKVSALDDGTSLLQVPINNFVANQDIPPVLLIGGRVFGYSDAPIDRQCVPKTNYCMLSVTVPAALLAADPIIRVKALMLDEDGLGPELHRTFNLFPQNLEREKLVYLTQAKDTASYLLFGRDLDQVEIVWPPGKAPVEPLPNSGGAESPKLLTLPLDFAKSASYVILRRPADHPFLVALTAPPKPDAAAADAAAPAPKFQDAIMVGADEAAIVGRQLDAIANVLFAGQKLTIAQQTPNLIQLRGLAAARVSAVPKTQSITLVPKTGASVTIPLDVVTSRVEVIQK
jgi:hypothetical protein